MDSLTSPHEKPPSVRRYSWFVVLCAVLGFLSSLTIHIAAYFAFIEFEIFLFYCRLEWVGVAFVALLLGFLMPTTRPRQQLLILLRWMCVAVGTLCFYALYGVGVYLSSEHPHKLGDKQYVMQRGRAVAREITQSEYHRIAKQEHRYYVMHLNRAFSMVWVVLFFGVSLYGAQYLRAIRRDDIHELSPEKYVAWWYIGGRR